jgi:hypothetical protein
MRLIIPVEGSYWQARSIEKWLEPKYVNPGIPADSYIFNSGALESYDEVVICEGCFSAMAVGTNAVAILGKEIPTKKLARLADSSVKNFIVALDYGANQWSTTLADKLLRYGKQVTVWNFQDEKDPADNGTYVPKKYDGFKTKVEMLLE